MNPRAIIVGLSGTELSDDERRFLSDHEPWGVILFARNCRSPEQVSRLTGEVRDCLGRKDAPVLIDQEGGRVQRLGPPHWPVYPPARRYGEIYANDRQAGLRAARLGGLLMATDLRRLGITVDCLPVLDVPVPGSDGIIGERAYGDRPEDVTALGSAAAKGLREGGVVPVMKHVPGHGRARVDSHKRLPRVDAPAQELAQTDFAPFRALRGLPAAMTAHVVFSAIDPHRPASVSPAVIGGIIRGEIGFQGLLMSDDLSMGALSGSIGERAQACCAAGCDVVLHCNARMEEMIEAAGRAPRLRGPAAVRAGNVLRAIKAEPQVATGRQRELFENLVGESASV